MIGTSGGADMQKLKHFAALYVRNEGVAWTFTIAWLALVAGALWRWSANYDASLRLDIEDWSFVATLTSGVFAPIGLLWIVRSFYVQKKELAATVRAASDQVEALKTQTQVAIDQYKRAITPAVTWDLRPYEVARLQDDWHVTLGLKAKNVGQGAAHAVHAVGYLVYENSGDPERRDHRVAETLLTNMESVEGSLDWYMSEEPPSTYTVYLVLACKDANSDRHANFVRMTIRPDYTAQRTMSEERFDADMAVFAATGEYYVPMDHAPTDNRPPDSV
jgi:hypothetical protein